MIWICLDMVYWFIIKFEYRNSLSYISVVCYTRWERYCRLVASKMGLVLLWQPPTDNIICIMFSWDIRLVYLLVNKLTTTIIAQEPCSSKTALHFGSGNNSESSGRQQAITWAGVDQDTLCHATNNYVFPFYRYLHLNVVVAMTTVALMHQGTC